MKYPQHLTKLQYVYNVCVNSQVVVPQGGSSPATITTLSPYVLVRAGNCVSMAALETRDFPHSSPHGIICHSRSSCLLLIVLISLSFNRIVYSPELQT